jgi:uncharacterized protein YcfJ
MKSLAVAAVTFALIGAAPQEASAQDAAAVAATVVGAAIGGVVGYYYFAGPVSTAIGVIAGGAIGDWWYTAAISRDAPTAAGKTKMYYTDTPRPLFQLIGYSGRAQPGLRTAAFSAAAD